MSVKFAAPQRSRKFLWAAGAAVALALGTIAIVPNHDGDAADTPKPAPSAVPVSVATVEQHDRVAWEEFSGRLEAVEKVDVRSRVAGQIEAIHFREGGLVKKGDLLVTIDPAPFAAEVARAQAQVASAQARLNFTKHEHERAQKLAGTGAMPVREMDSRANDYNEAQAALRAASAALTTAQLNLGYTKIHAPVAGRVGRAEITAGNLVASGAGAPVLTTLVSVDPIYASFDADEKVIMQAIHGLRDPAGGSFQVERIPVEMESAAANQPPVSGHVQMINNTVDASSGTVRVRAQFNNTDGSLMPGQFARLRMGQPAPEPTILISDRAVGSDQDKKYVMVVDEANKAEYREVSLGATQDGLRVVTKGLSAGERIIVTGLQRVRPGALVAPTDTPMNPNATDAAKLVQR